MGALANQRVVCGVLAACLVAAGCSGVVQTQSTVQPPAGGTVSAPDSTVAASPVTATYVPTQPIPGVEPAATPQTVVSTAAVVPTPAVAVTRAVAATPVAASTPVVAGGSSGVVEDLTNLAINDLAGRASVSQAEVSVVTTAPVEWRDTSLGCPQPGRVYAQVITQGFRIILEARGKSYEYHTDSSRVVLCQIQ